MACDPSAKVNTSRCSVDCARQPCDIEQYGDIGGTGVILGFTVTAWFVVALLLVYYVTVYDYTLDIYRPKDDFKTVAAHPNPVDRVFLSTVRKWRLIDYSETSPETKKKINKVFNKCIVAFADLQIMTGIGILVSGIRPTVCGLQAYHLQLIVHLAWFSSVTHLAALSFLRHYLVNRPQQLYVRGLLMAVLAGFLALGVGLTGHFDWDFQDVDRDEGVSPSYFARCVFRDKIHDESEALESMVFDVFLIVYGYTIRLLKTWKRGSNAPVRASNYLFYSSSAELRRWKLQERRWTIRYDYLWTGVLQPIKLAFPCVVYLQLNLFTSYLAEVFFLLFSIIWRTVRLTRLVRRYRPSSENDWAFGQVLPLVMKAAPFVLLLTPTASLYRARWQRRGDPDEEGFPLGSIRGKIIYVQKF